MKTNTNYNTKKESLSKVPWAPLAFVLSALLTIWMLVPTNFANSGYLTSRLAPKGVAASTEQTAEELSNNWRVQTAPITFDHMYRNAR